MTNRRRLVATALLAAGLASGGGCEGPSPYQRLQNKLHTSNQQISKLRRQNKQLRAALIAQGKQVETLQALGDLRLEKISHPIKIELSRYSGGRDTDETPGDDVLKVYLRPIDKHGSAIKAPGDVKIQLYDLAAPPEQNLIGEYKWSVDEIQKHWKSSLMTQHYSLDCPLESDPPSHGEVTVRAEFVDYLTGFTLTAQRVCKIVGAPHTQPATKPAQ